MTRPAKISLSSIGRSALILAGGTAAVQVVGVARELYLAAQVGLSRELDALLIAIALPTTVASFITSGIVTALVPAYVEAREVEGHEYARSIAGAVLLAIAVVGLVFTGLLALLSGPAVDLTGPGLDAGSRAQAVTYLQFLAPLTLLSAVTGILYAICQAEERFLALAFASLAASMTTLVLLLVLWDSLELAALAVGTLLGQAVNALALFVATLRASIAPRLRLQLRRADVIALVRHAAPLTASSAIMQLNIIVDRAVASLLAPGAVSALRYAEVLVRTPISTIGPAWGAAVYPALVRSARAGEEGVAGTTSASLRYAIAGFVPLAALTAAVAPVAVAVAYGRGAFTAADVERTALVVAGFAPLLVILMTSPVLAGAHNARRNGRVLLMGGTLNVILNAILDVVLGTAIGVAGVALSSSLTSTIVTIFFARRLAAAEPAFDLRQVARTTSRALVAATIPALLVASIAWSGLVPTDLLPALLSLAAFGAFGLLAYGFLARLVGLEEAIAVMRVVARPLRRRAG